MAHRKLQQEIDRVFKKINEGLEVFNTYYDRHEACTNNPSQKDKLESDLKREVKKLQRLREQIKSWQSSPEVKDKDSLLDYRRSVEVAMEKYKAVEKASKEKAYSNISLKRSEVLDPQERERRIVADYLSQSIDELERQYDLLQVEVDRLLLLNKKKKTATSANEEKKKGLKELQARYRWHQQQMELALRLIANEELDPQLVKDIEDDINYFIESNQAPDFVEDDTIYEGLNLDANEAIAHEVAASFAAQASDDAAEEEASKDTSKISKKEQRRLEREAKKAAKAAAKTTLDGAPSIATTTTTTTTPPPPPPPPLETAISALTEASKGRPEASISTPAEPPKTATTNTSPSPSPMIASAPTSIPSTANTTTATIASAASISKPQTPLSKPSPHNLTRTSTPEPQGHTHFHQSLNGTTTTSTLKPATVPVRPAGELKWAVAAAQAAEKDKKHVSNQNPLTATSSATSSRPNSVVSTPMVSKSSLVTQEKPPTAASVLTAGVIATASPVAQAMGLSQQPQQQQQQQHPTSGSMEVGAASNNFTNSLLTSQVPEEESHELELLIDDYNSDLSDDELEEEPRELVMDEQELNRRSQIKKSLEESMCDNIGLLCLPSGIQDFIMCSVVSKNKLHIDGKLGGYRRPLDACKVSRLDPIPLGVNPPSPLDALRSTNQWDLIRCTIFGMEPMENEISELDDILDRFRPLETFTLFYSYYYSITPLERKIAMALLKERNWKISKGGNTWFLRQSATKFSNELCEVADYKIFKLDDWTVVDKLNFKLDYSVLEEIPLQATAMRQGESSMSHGQQLLQQLKQGPIPNKFSSEGIVAQK